MSRLSLTQSDHDLIRAMLAYGAHYGAIARRVGVSTATVGNVARGRSKRPTDPTPSIAEVLGPVKSTPGDPTPNEIADACEKLRRHRYRGEHQHAWTVPEVATLANGGVS